MPGKKILLLLVFCLLSCRNKETERQNIQKKANRIYIKVEDFNTFLKRFSSDEGFQLSRIKFPLISKFYDVDSIEVKIISTPKKGWEFFDIKNLSDKTYFKKIIKEHNKKYIFNIQMEGTGVYVDYVFELMEAEWFLTTTIDQST